MHLFFFRDIMGQLLISSINLCKKKCYIIWKTIYFQPLPVCNFEERRVTTIPIMLMGNFWTSTSFTLTFSFGISLISLPYILMVTFLV